MQVREMFLNSIDNESNYRLLLLLALEATKGSSHPVLELGPSEGSTPYLHAYCESEERSLVSLDENVFATMKFRHLASMRHEVQCCAWSAAPIEQGLWSVALINHAPGDRRWADAMRLLHRCEIIVLHNTEPAADHGYQFSKIWSEFKYRVDVKTAGAWASAVSNACDIYAWRGTRLGDYVVTAGFDDIKPDPVQEAVRQFLSDEGGAG